MPTLAAVACYVPDAVSLAHSYFAGEDEPSDSDLVVCLAAAAVAIVEAA